MRYSQLSALLLTSALSTTSFAYSLDVSEPTLNTNLPSASGLIEKDGSLVAVGDDSPWLFTLNKDFSVNDKYLIKEYPIKEDGRILKKVKPDYEAMAKVSYLNKPHVLLLGSGSKAKVREWAYLISEDKKTKIERSLSPLYAQLYKAGGLTGEQEINIEGLVTTPKEAYIFNRGNSGDNLIFKMPLSELFTYIEGNDNAVTSLETYKVTLPVINGFEAGLSGGEYWHKNDSLIYTASVEATGDAYNDGEILGSFVGIINIKDLKQGKTLELTNSSVPLLKDSKKIITKVESVAIYKETSSSLAGALVSDNDDGTSEFFNFTLKK